MTDVGSTDKPFVPYEPATPNRWPNRWQWLRTARANAIDLFPQAAYEQARTSTRVFGRKLSVIADPAAITHICGVGGSNYRLSNLHLRVLKPALRDGIIVAEGETWRGQRRSGLGFTGRRAFAERLDIAAMRERIDAGVDAHASAGRADPLPALVPLAIDLVAQTVFGVSDRIATDEVLRTIEAHRKIIEKFDLLDGIGAPYWMWSRKMWRARQVTRKLDAAIHAAIQRFHGTSDASARDLVSSVLTGFESVAVTSSWAIAILGRNPKLAHRLQQQLESTDPTAASYYEPPADELSAFLLEVMRLYPPLPLIYRASIRRHELAIGTFEAGEQLCISPWVVHRHSALWDRPNEFDWRRWRGQAPNTCDAYMPFGIGSRQCIGLHVGLVLVKAIVHRVLERCDIRCDELPRPRAGVSLRPSRPLHVTLSLRQAQTIATES